MRVITDVPGARTSAVVVRRVVVRRRFDPGSCYAFAPRTDERDSNVTLRHVALATLGLFQPEFPSRLCDARSACGAFFEIAYHTSQGRVQHDARGGNMVWVAYLGLSGSVLFAVSCALILLGAPPKVVIDLAVSTASLMLGGAMLANFFALGIRRRSAQAPHPTSAALMVALTPSYAPVSRQTAPAAAASSPPPLPPRPRNRYADLPRQQLRVPVLRDPEPPARPGPPAVVIVQAVRRRHFG